MDPSPIDEGLSNDDLLKSILEYSTLLELMKIREVSKRWKEIIDHGWEKRSGWEIDGEARCMKWDELVIFHKRTVTKVNIDETDLHILKRRNYLSVRTPFPIPNRFAGPPHFEETKVYYWLEMLRVIYFGNIKSKQWHLASQPFNGHLSFICDIGPDTPEFNFQLQIQKILGVKDN